MKKFFFLFILSIAIFNKSKAQVFYTENFSSAAGWSLSNVLGIEGANPNFFLISANEGGGITPNLGVPTSCGVANNNNNTMHITSVFNPTGGASYDAGGLCGLLFCPQTNRRAESPVINCSGKSNITVSFNYIENGQAQIDNAQFWYYDGTNWTMLDDMPKTLTGCNGQGLWVSRTITLPASANNNANVKYGFSWINNDDGVGTDPSFAVDDITFSSPVVNNTISTSALPITPNGICACANLQVSFTSSGTFNAGNIYTAYLSDALGNFTSAVAIGTLNSTANSGSIATIIPCNTPTGNQYRIRVESSNPAVVGSNNGTNFLINASVTPTISVSASPNFPVCNGVPVTFIATLTNPGSNPTYSWTLNSLPVGTNSSTYTAGTLNNGDVIICSANSNAACVNNPTVVSIPITALINATPNVTASATPSASICAGDSVKLNGGGAISYTWTGGILDNVYFFPTTTSIYTVVGVDANGCSNTSTIVVQVSPAITPTVSISATPTIPFINSPAIYTANVPGTIPNFQLEWYVGGILNTTINSPNTTFNFTPLNINDYVFAKLLPQGDCFSPQNATSTSIYSQHPDGISSFLPIQIKLYPNPIENQFWIEGMKEKDEILLYDISGKTLLKKQLLSNEKEYINLNTFSGSIYFLKLKIETKNYFIKLIKK
ncbi:MAG: T9SS type A sorting domain-containing protein [Chitinophagaceae bacterium]|nr:T9SS type A sorting domain-containing protein [Chitinophagaceae bacterium]